MSLYSLEPHHYKPTHGVDRFVPSSRPIPSSGTRYAAPTTVDVFLEYDAYGVPDWDGYSADPISQETIQTARRFRNLWPRQIPVADIAPGADGTIGFEWRSGPPSARVVTFIEVGPGNTIKALRVRPGSEPPERWEPRPVMVGTLDFLNILFPPDEPG